MVLFFFAGHNLASRFVSDHEVIELAAALLVIAAHFQWGDGIQIVSACALRGVDDVNVPAWIAGFSYWIIALPLGWWWGLQQGYGSEGVWAALALGLGIAALLLAFRAWRKLGPEEST